MPRSVIKPVISAAGVTSKAGLGAGHTVGHSLHCIQRASHVVAIALRRESSRGAVGAPSVERAGGRRDVKRNTVMLRQNGQTVGTDLIGDITVGSDAIGSRDHQMHLIFSAIKDAAMLSQHRDIQPRAAQLPRRQPRPLQ